MNNKMTRALSLLAAHPEGLCGTDLVRLSKEQPAGPALRVWNVYSLLGIR